MIRDHSHSCERSAFTMVEVMVVILILAILSSLISSVVVKGMDKATESQTRKEISEMEVALRAFMLDYGLTDPPPSYLYLSETDPLNTLGKGDAQTAAFLEKMFGKNLGKLGYVDWNGNGQSDPPYAVQEKECLVFYLGGIPNSVAVRGGATPAPQGFSANNINPSAPGGKRKGPYFNFIASRLFPQPQQVIPAWLGFFFYIDPWMSKSGVLYQIGTPYAFFSSRGIRSTYDTSPDSGAKPYMTSNGQYMNPNTYQILSAGRDGQFGNPLWNPSSGALGAGADDQANFSSTLLGAGQN